MDLPQKQAFYWTPRILGILFALFLSLFALDVFGMEGSLWAKIGGFLLHLFPVYGVIIALVIAWRWEWIGGLLFIGISVFFGLRFGGLDNWQNILILSGPAFLIGALFLVNWFNRRQVKPGV